jgi:hypothetical protein
VNTTDPANRQDLNTLDHPPAPSKVGTPSRLLALCFVSLVVMTPWPLLGILVSHRSFDEAAEAFMLFGGITLFALMPLACFGVSQEVLIGLMALVWLAAALVPDFWFRRRLTSWKTLAMLLGIQSAFSLAQAVMGALLVFGKNI